MEQPSYINFYTTTLSLYTKQPAFPQRTKIPIKPTQKNHSCSILILETTRIYTYGPIKKATIRRQFISHALN
jgi:hypothetical protein